MEDVFNKLIRRVLALTIRCPKRPRTKGDILKYALRGYLNNGSLGLCAAISKAIVHFRYNLDIIRGGYENLSLVFPLFCYEIASEKFHADGWKYGLWWPHTDWKNRYRFMKWLIRQYNNVEL